jgi:hypothetical protein
MSRPFQLTLHGTGLSVPVEGDPPIRGFFVLRRVLADNPKDAERKAIAALEQEERYRELVGTTERESGSRAGCRVRLDDIGYLSWWRWYFTKCSPSFIFYGDDGPVT